MPADIPDQPYSATRQGTANTDGAVSLRFPSITAGLWGVIERLTLTTDTPSGIAQVVVGGMEGTLDVIAGVQGNAGPYVLPPNDELTLDYSGLTPGTIVTAQVDGYLTADPPSLAPTIAPKQAQQQWIGDSLTFTPTGAAAQGFGPFSVSQWHGIEYRMRAVGQDLEVTFQWYDDANLSNLMAEERFVTQQAVSSQVRNGFAPNRGPYLWVIIDPNSGTPEVNLIFSNRIATYDVGIRWGTLVDVDNVSVGAGVERDDLLQPYRGPVFLFYVTTAAASIFELAYYVQVFGGLQRVGRLVRFTNAANPQHLVLHVPSYIVRAEFTNNDGVTRAYSCSVVSIA